MSKICTVESNNDYYNVGNSNIICVYTWLNVLVIIAFVEYARSCYEPFY